MGASLLKKITRQHLEVFLKGQATDKYTLDIGSGGSLYQYDRFFPDRITVDIDPARNPEVVGDIHALPFDQNTFDTVLCVEVLEHCIDPKKAFSEMHRVLKSGGKLVLTTRFVYPLHDTPNDFWRFTKYGLQELAKEGFVITELLPEVGTFSTIGVLLQRIAYQTNLFANGIFKLKLFILAWIFNHLNWMIRQEYGDIKKTARETDILTSGYYLVATKK